MRSARLVRGAVALALSMLIAATAAAQPESGAQKIAEAQYTKGLELLQAGRAAEALAVLDSSFEASPSPNTQLLRGHALRALGRRVEAMTAYEDVVTVAGGLVRRGDKRYEATLADAGTWIAFLRSELAELTVEIRTSGRDFSATISGKSVAPVRDASDVARIHVFREPGPVNVTIVPLGGEASTSYEELTAGAKKTVSFDLSPPAVRASAVHTPPTVTFVSWGIGLAGFGMLGIAGGLALSGMSDLDACRPRCDQDDVDDTETKAIVANVGLAIGLAGAVVGGVVWLGVELASPKDTSPVKVSAGLAPAPGGATIELALEL